jgi:hypothetical protein
VAALLTVIVLRRGRTALSRADMDLQLCGAHYTVCRRRWCSRLNSQGGNNLFVLVGRSAKPASGADAAAAAEVQQVWLCVHCSRQSAASGAVS